MSVTAQPTDVLPDDLRAALDRVADALTAVFAGDPAPYAALWALGAPPTLFGAWGPIEKGHGLPAARPAGVRISGVCGVTAPGLPSSSDDRHRTRPL